MKILFTADVHIKLGQKNVPIEWARNRFNMLWEQLREQQKQCDLFVVGGDIFDKLQSTPNTYDFIWLDLCGNLSTSNMYNIISVVQTSLKNHCIFAFTLASAREQRTKIFTNLYNCTGQDFRFKVFPKMIVKMGRMFHPKLALNKIIKYKNTVFC
jgi:hypothetical protein